MVLVVGQVKIKQTEVRIRPKDTFMAEGWPKGSTRPCRGAGWAAERVSAELEAEGEGYTDDLPLSREFWSSCKSFGTSYELNMVSFPNSYLEALITSGLF